MNAKNMVVTWGTPCDFVFESWKARTPTGFWLGVVACFLTTIIATAYGPIFRKQLKIRNKNRFELGLGFLFEYLLKLYLMLLMMTMNGQVCIAIALGTALGSTLFGLYGETIRRRIFKTECSGLIDDDK